MNFKLTSEQKMIQKEVRDFTQKEIEPISSEIEEIGEYPKEIMQNIAGLGLTGLTVSEEFGGSKMDYLSLALTLCEIAKSSPALAFITAVQNISGFALEKIIKCNNTSQYSPVIKQYLREICQGEKVAATAFSESQMKLEINECIVNGFCDYVLLSDAADIFIVPAAEQLFIVDKTRHGFKLDSKKELIGLRSANAYKLAFNECKPESIINDKDQAAKIIKEIFFIEDLTSGAILLGISQALFDMALKYSRQRKQFGKALYEFGLVKEMLADMEAKISALEAYVYTTASGFDNAGQIGAGVYPRRAQTSFASDTAALCAKDAIQIYGGYGYSKDYPLERLMRDSKVLETLSL